LGKSCNDEWAMITPVKIIQVVVLAAPPFSDITKF
jgi:hypothetical protein